MARFNVAVKSRVVETTNLAGGKAVALSDKQQIVAILLTSFLKNQYYKKTEDTQADFVKLVQDAADKKFVAKAAIFARKEFGMRSITHVAAGEIARLVKGEEWTRRFIKRVIHRPDDMLEIMSYYTANYGKRKIPNCLKDGLRAAFAIFDSYQLAKYKGEGKGISMIDLVNLVHPRPIPGVNAEALKSLMKGELKATQTWEAKLSEAGQKAETDEQKVDLKADAWKELIETRKIGYFALLRNLRNIIEQAPDMVDKACELLTDAKLIQKSLVLPFRFDTAAVEISKLAASAGARKITMALVKAMDISCANVPKLPGRTLVALDISGSMKGRPAQIGSLFTAILAKANNADVINFGSQAAYVGYNPMDSVLTIANCFPNRNQGTDFRTIFNTADKPYDRIIILSDMQAWMGISRPEAEYRAYKKRHNCDPFLYSFDLAGHGTTQFTNEKRAEISGFSEKIFDIMALCETDKDALIHKIDAIEI